MFHFVLTRLQYSKSLPYLPYFLCSLLWFVGLFANIQVLTFFWVNVFPLCQNCGWENRISCKSPEYRTLGRRELFPSWCPPCHLPSLDHSEPAAYYWTFSQGLSVEPARQLSSPRRNVVIVIMAPKHQLTYNFSFKKHFHWRRNEYKGTDPLCVCIRFPLSSFYLTFYSQMMYPSHYFLIKRFLLPPKWNGSDSGWWLHLKNDFTC